MRSTPVPWQQIGATQYVFAGIGETSFKVSPFHAATVLVLVEGLMTEFATPLNEFFI